MNRLSPILAAALLLALAACATPKKTESVAPKAAPPPAAEELIRDKFVVPGERAGPILLGMSLRKLVGVVGEPVSSTAARIPGGRSALLYRYADPDASPDGAMLVMVRETDQTVYSIQLDRIESFQTREGVRYGSSEALVRASFGKPQSIQESGAGEIPRAYCYLSGLAVRLNATGNVESLTVFPGSDLRKICKAQ
ncbi:MAG: hypothetical protein HY067_08375 [Betaproteobacteria bacterium]|nr:hypothetical protein [Betaproteobacteria bacterium]